MSIFTADPNPGTLPATPDIPTSPTYEHAEDIGTRHWYDDYPLPPEVEHFIERSRQIREDLAAAVRACEQARETKETHR